MVAYHYALLLNDASCSLDSSFTFQPGVLKMRRFAELLRIVHEEFPNYRIYPV